MCVCIFVAVFEPVCVNACVYMYVCEYTCMCISVCHVYVCKNVCVSQSFLGPVTGQYRNDRPGGGASCFTG